MSTENAPAAVAEQSKVVPAEKKAVRQLAITEQGAFALQTIEDQKQFAQTLLSEKLISSSFTSPAQVIIGFQYAKAMRMDVILAMRKMYVVNNVPTLFGEAPLSLCQNHPLWEGIEEFFVDKEINRICVENKNLSAEVYASVTRVWRKGEKAMQEDFFSIDDMERAGVDTTNTGKKKEVWEKWRRDMLRYKGRARALKTKFADALSGIAIAEHDFHFNPEMPDVRVVRSTKAADELNREYLDEAKEVTGQASLGPGQG